MVYAFAEGRAVEQAARPVFMSITTLLTLVLLLGAVVAWLRSGGSRLGGAALATLAWVSVALLVLRAAANSFTGEGINYATLYHVWYGFEGAGWRDYVGVIGWGIAGLALPAVALAALGWWVGRRPVRRGWIALAGVLVAGSLAVNPGARDLVRLAHPPPAQTADFLRHYRPPTLRPIAAEHPNLVFIYAESLERTFFDETLFPGLIKELRTLEAEATSFTDIQTVHGSGFTMGGMVGSLCGVPLFAPADPNSMGGMDAFLPGATGLGDLLRAQGYHLTFMGGAHSSFAGKGRFLRTHGFHDVEGFESLYPKVGDKAYITNWGLYDDTLFDLVYARFEELSRQGGRFGLFLLTLDTHTPHGHVSRSAQTIRFGDGSNPMLNAVAASEHLIARFVRRLQASPYAKNTVIVVSSDHVAMHNDASDTLDRGRRRNLFLVLDPRQPTGTRIARAGSTLDVGATLLPFLGFRGVIGLGRDLRDPTVSDEELQHIRQQDTLLSWREELARFWEFPQLRDALTFAANPPAVGIGGRQFTPPLLARFEADDRATLQFESGPEAPARLAAQAQQLPPGTRFLYVAPTPTNAADWELVAGRGGGRPVRIPLSSPARLARAELERAWAP
jgi:phosphoglycerol transferase